MVRNNENFKKVWKETAMVSFAGGEKGRYKPRQTSLKKGSIRPTFKADISRIEVGNLQCCN
jgi:hypothetical protein